MEKDEVCEREITAPGELLSNRFNLLLSAVEGPLRFFSTAISRVNCALIPLKLHCAGPHSSCATKIIVCLKVRPYCSFLLSPLYTTASKLRAGGERPSLSLSCEERWPLSICTCAVAKSFVSSAQSHTHPTPREIQIWNEQRMGALCCEGRKWKKMTQKP